MKSLTVKLMYRMRVADFGLLACVVAVGLVVGCARSTLPLTNLTLPLPASPITMESVKEVFGSYREGNFQNRSRTDAFLGMHQKFVREYPFSEWKGIDWDTLYDTHVPRVEAASQAKDELAYYLALRSYLYSIPDAGVSISTPDAYRDAAVGAGFGFSMLPLDDGRVVVVRVEPGFFADMAGIEWGAEIIAWNGLPIAEALEQTSLLWSDAPPATDECRRFEQCALLTRAPAGTKATLKFRNPESDEVWITQLEARRDFYRSLEDLTRQKKTITEFDSPLETRILDGNIGYIQIYCHAATLAMPFPARAFRNAMEQFLKADVAGLVLDLRGDVGGQDQLAVTYAGHFTKSPLFYRNVVAFDYDKGGFALKEDASMTIEPRAPYFGGPVMVLIQHTTRDNGQALADSLHQLPNVALMGFTGTDGSWSFPGGQVTVPGGHVITYPIGRFLDSTDTIRVTSSGKMESRVKPDIRVPLTFEAYESFFREDRDVVLERAIAEIKVRAAAKTK